MTAKLQIVANARKAFENWTLGAKPWPHAWVREDLLRTSDGDYINRYVANEWRVWFAAWIAATQ